MKFSKFTFLAFLIFNGLLSTSQTKLIAHRSHSGADGAIDKEGEGNLGMVMPEMRIDTVIKIAHKTVVVVKSYNWGMERRETVRNHPDFCNPAITINDLKRMYPRIVFIGFESEKIKDDNGNRKKNLFYIFFSFDNLKDSLSLVLCIGFCTLLFGFLAWKSQVRKLEQVAIKMLP